MYFQESFGFCLSVNESLLNFVFPGQEFFVTLDHPERVLHFYEQVSDWTTYRVTTRMRTKISNTVEKCKNTNTDFNTLMDEYEEYQKCLLNHTFNVKNILFLGFLIPVTDYFPQGGRRCKNNIRDKTFQFSFLSTYEALMKQLFYHLNGYFFNLQLFLVSIWRKWELLHESW